jgi:hypothetical protein
MLEGSPESCLVAIEWLSSARQRLT